jgi:hypothetical protein
MKLVSRKLNLFSDRRSSREAVDWSETICGVRVRSKPSIPPIAVTGRDKWNIISSLALWFAARPKTEAVEEPRCRTLESRATLSLVCLELLQARTAARHYLETRRRPTHDAQLTTEAWQAHRAAIALELSLSDWTAVVSAYDAVNRIMGGTCDTLLAGKTPDSFRRISVGVITPMLQEIERGCVALAPYALDVMRLPAD